VVNLSSDRENIQIHYTLDGSLPTDQSPAYVHPFVLKNSTLISARCFRNGKAVSDSIHQRVRQVVPEPASNPGELVEGLKTFYYEGEWDSIPDFRTMKPLKQTLIPNFNLTDRQRDDYYAFEYQGYIQIDQPGVYDFYTDSDDGSNLYINNTLVVNNDGLHGMELKKGSIPLEKGFHKIKVGFFEKNGNDDLKVYYQGPKFDRILIPDNILFSKK
jgi:alpha-L-fucosidase